MASDLAQIPLSPALGATLARASNIAVSAGSAEITLEQLLAALCEDADAIAILEASQIDARRLRDHLASSGALSARGSGMAGAQPTISLDVRRILEAATAAARGSRRSEINGAIVIAAIVGDARSQAAAILHEGGLTFDNAIRALQSTLAQPQPQYGQPPVADDVLARARERVQSRAAPSLRDIIKDMPRTAPPPPIVMPAPVAPMQSPVAAPSAPPQRFEPQLEQPPQASQSHGAPAEAAPAKPSVSATIGSPEEAAHQLGSDVPAAETALTSPSSAVPQEPRIPVRAAPPPPPAGSALSSLRKQSSTDGEAPSDHGSFDPGYPNLGGGDMPPSPPVRFPELARPAAGPVMPPPIPMPPGRGFSPGDRLAPARGPMPPPPAGYPQPPGGVIGMPAPPPPVSMRAPPQAQAGDKPVRSRKKKGGQKTEAGQLVENIPRAMRVDRTERVEIRIAKASVKQLTDGLDGGGAARQHDIAITRAMSVRMRAPEGGFFIETASPETQWIENALGYPSDEYASWRFLVTPQERGWSRLQIIVSARTIGGDGGAAESALPDQVVEVKVRANLKRALGRLVGWTVAAIAGGALSMFGQSAYQLVQTLVGKLPH